MNIPFTGLKRQYIQLREEILDVTDRVLMSGQLMNGPHTIEFEDWLARKNFSRFAITCHSGTQALEIIAAYWALNETVKPSTVVIPSISYVATANAFIRAGWDIHFIDVDQHGLLDTSKIPHNLNYEAVVLVGLYGASISHHADLRTWNDWIYTDKIIIEDAAQHWLSANCKRIGHSSTAISFDPMKNLSCYGNGGAVITDIKDLADFALAYRSNGKHTGHKNTGTNSRMSELDCATMLVKTDYIDRWQARRREIAAHYIERLHGHNIRCLIDDTNFHDHAFHKFVIEVDNRDAVQAHMTAAGIETKIHYQHALPDHSAYRAYPAPDMLGACYSLTRRCLSLPLYPELEDYEVEYITDRLLEIVS